MKALVVCGGEAVLHVTATSRDRKTKGIRMRRKETDITTFTASHLTCRPSGKQETVTVVVDGVEYVGVASVKVAGSWELTAKKTFPVSLASST